MCTQMQSGPNVASQGMSGLQALSNVPATEPPTPHPQQFMAAIPVQPVLAGGFPAPAATVSASAEVISLIFYFGSFIFCIVDVIQIFLMV